MLKHFKSKKSYSKFLAYEHIHGLEKQGHHPDVIIAGHRHKVHEDSSKHLTKMRSMYK